ncbi:adenylate/guanylate cyclase domain-containing protein [Ramlibacter lithotrophicus]|nr:adenylate/guanylate cyclase domain-containing protein [Ramlibacter lithotrophicus]
MNRETSSLTGAPTLMAVVFTDVVGYSARMQQDESDTIRLVQLDFEEMRRCCAKHGGRCLNTMGDGMMLAFTSAADAVAFALEVQDLFAHRDPQANGHPSLQHRIGVHLGDVFRLESGQLAGDGVNVAARLETAAPPGGICISQAVHDIVKGKLALGATFAGERTFKNIATPVRVWHVHVVGRAKLARRLQSHFSAQRRKLVAAGAAAMVAASSLAWWQWRSARSSPDRTLAVLPFTNLSDDKDAAYFADGVHEDLLTQLAMLRDLKVVSRTSVLEYRGRTRSMRQIASELGVAALVEGSVRRAGNIIRVTAQLIDARADRHLWARRYDRELKDIFAVQSELAADIAGALQVSLSGQERERLARMPTRSAEAYDLYLRHQALLAAAWGLRPVSGHPERLDLLQRAVSIDPSFALAWARLGAEHARAYSNGIDWSEARRELAHYAVGRALALAPTEPLVKLEEGYVAFRVFHDHERATRAYKAVLAIAPNNADALYGLAFVERDRGHGAETVKLLDRAIAFDSRNALVLWALARTYAEYRQYEKGQAYRRRLVELRPGDPVLESGYALVEYWRTGRWDAYEQWLARQPEGAERRLTGVRWMETRRAALEGDFATALRLLEQDSADFDPSRSVSGRIEKLSMLAVASKAAGDLAKAHRLAKQLLAEVEPRSAELPDRSSLWLEKALMYAVLGDRDAAFAAHRRALAIAERTPERDEKEYVRRSALDLHALLGDKDAAIADFARQVRLPGFWVHEQKTNLALASLFSDPRFQAIVDDPASNAPLPLEMHIDGQLPK